MAPYTAARSKPPVITLTEADHDRLSALAERVSGKTPVVAKQLLAELDRAQVVAIGNLPANVVRMGVTAYFTIDDSQDWTATLVFPGDADIARGKISILTPIGAALIGLAVGQTIEWKAPDGRIRSLTLKAVSTNHKTAAPEPVAQALQKI